MKRRGLGSINWGSLGRQYGPRPELPPGPYYGQPGYQMDTLGQPPSPAGPLGAKPDWVKQSDFDLANSTIAGGGEAADNMKKFLAALSAPSPDVQEAIARRLSPQIARQTETPVGTPGSAITEVAPHMMPSGVVSVRPAYGNTQGDERVQRFLEMQKLLQRQGVNLP